MRNISIGPAGWHAAGEDGCDPKSRILKIKDILHADHVETRLFHMF